MWPGSTHPCPAGRPCAPPYCVIDSDIKGFDKINPSSTLVPFDVLSLLLSRVVFAMDDYQTSLLSGYKPNKFNCLPGSSKFSAESDG